ncbi:hypothetical protein [Yinghuangia soli]|uniref:Integral membrane protein n=1 Tax=Yinghuangia soli TaxID=2908204 RepID=A0AA41Q2V4_9ACTN|nr:hypothetical protein [Yinghuangia soli]MCF2529955.1 hypothetical protein [Yinghuangia soli]
MTDAAPAPTAFGALRSLPPSFRIATGIVAAETVIGLGFSLYILLASLFGDPVDEGKGISEGIYLLLLGLGMLATTVGLVRGRRWSRSPAITINLVVLGIGYWMGSGSGRWVFGIAIIAVGLAAIVILGRPSLYQALENLHEERTAERRAAEQPAEEKPAAKPAAARPGGQARTGDKRKKRKK